MRFGANADRGVNNLEGAGSFLDFQTLFILPGEMNVPDAFLYKRRCRRAGTGIQNGNLLVQPGEVVHGLLTIASAKNHRSPGGVETELSVSRSLRVWRYDGDAVLDQVGPVLTAFRVACAHHEDNRGRVRQGIVR